jgi:mRNA-degrading endonuclease RelE of RelBE toxin-antitoxin system
MPEYRIEFTGEAKADLDYYAAFERRIVTSQIRAQLLHEPLVETKNRKSLRENPVASWELRAGRFRVFYEVDEGLRTVTIVAVGHKEHNALLIQGKEVTL